MAPTVLVTGAGRGIGRATVEAFADRGWRAVAGVRDMDAAREAYSGRPGVELVHLDLDDAEAIPHAVARAQELAGGALTCVVPNAGYAVMGAIEDVDLTESRRMFQTNVFGNLAVLQAALPAMREARAGVVVLVSSIGAHITNPLVGIYHASKFALEAIALELLLELRPFGVRVHAVEPGMVNTTFGSATRVTGGLARGEGPYMPLLEQLRPGFLAWREREGIGPEPVAQAVVAAAVDPATPYRVRVGGDARRIGEAVETLDDERFQDWFLEFLTIRWGRETP